MNDLQGSSIPYVLDRFCGDTGLATTNCSELLGVSKSTMCRWMRGKNVTQAWQWRTVKRTIDRLDAHNQRSGLYLTLAGKSQSDKVRILKAVLAS